MFCVQVDLCGHATLASAHVLFSTGLIDSETVKFDTLSGALTAKHLKIDDEIELDFPLVPTFEVNYIDDDLSLFSKALNGATIVDVKATKKDILVNIYFYQLLSPFLSCYGGAIESNLDSFRLICRLCFHLGKLSLNCSQD